MDVIEQAYLETVLAAITKQETECLLQILARYGQKFNKRVGIESVTRTLFDNDKNYWQYMYNRNEKDEYWLMDRRVFVDESGTPKLNVHFNPTLI